MAYVGNYTKGETKLFQMEERLDYIKMTLGSLYAEPTYTDPEIEMQVQVRIDDLEDERIELEKQLVDLRHYLLHWDD